MTRVVAGHLDDARLEQVYRIGVDEVSYRKGHRYLTVVADHDRDGAVMQPPGPTGDVDDDASRGEGDSGDVGPEDCEHLVAVVARTRSLPSMVRLAWQLRT